MADDLARVGRGSSGSEPIPPGSGDELPEDLDVTAYIGPYVFPDIRRRRIAGTCYVVIGALALWAGLAAGNRGFLFAGVLLLVDRGVPLRGRWHVGVDQTEALAVASRTVGLSRSGTRRRSSVGAGCSAVRRGASWCTAPTSRRASAGLVELDAVDGHVLGEYTERNPEDWSKFGRA